MNRRWLRASAMVVFSVMLLAGCGANQTKADDTPAKGPETAGAAESYQVISEKKEYQMLKGSRDSDGFTKYIIRIFDDDRKMLIERSYKLTRDTIGLGMLDKDIVIWKIGIGTGLNYTHYYDRKNRRESPMYTTPLLVGYGKVVAPKRGKLIVTDMFDHKVLYKELLIEDFPPVANPVDAFHEIKWLEKEKLSVTHLVGKRGENYTIRTVVFDLNE